jgi:hypothetical protein
MIFSMKTMYKLYKEVLVVGDFINYFLQLAYFQCVVCNIQPSKVVLSY